MADPRVTYLDAINAWNKVDAELRELLKTIRGTADQIEKSPDRFHFEGISIEGILAHPTPVAVWPTASRIQECLVNWRAASEDAREAFFAVPEAHRGTKPGGVGDLPQVLIRPREPRRS
jgi:hypothetical protein